MNVICENLTPGLSRETCPLLLCASIQYTAVAQIACIAILLWLERDAPCHTEPMHQFDMKSSQLPVSSRLMEDCRVRAYRAIQLIWEQHHVEETGELHHAREISRTDYG